jgi:hypothetical protein
MLYNCFSLSLVSHLHTQSLLPSCSGAAWNVSKRWHPTFVICTNKRPTKKHMQKWSTQRKVGWFLLSSATCFCFPLPLVCAEVGDGECCCFVFVLVLVLSGHVGGWLRRDVDSLVGLRDQVILNLCAIFSFSMSLPVVVAAKAKAKESDPEQVEKLAKHVDEVYCVDVADCERRFAEHTRAFLDFSPHHRAK